MNRLSLLVFALSGALIVSTGCPKKGGKLDTDGGTDAGVDAGPPPPPARELVDWKLFGDMPLDNGVIDPQLEARGFGWFAFSMQGNYAEIVRRTHSNTPTGQPVVEMPKTDVGAGQIFLAGLARGGQGPRVASIWVGRPAGDTDLSAISVSLLAFDPQAGQDRAFDLAESTAEGSMFEQEGVMWQNRIATIDVDLFGWTMLAVSDASSQPLFITGPVVAPAATRTGLYAPVPPAAVRQELKAGELEAVRLARLAIKERLAATDLEAARERMLKRSQEMIKAVNRARAAKAQQPQPQP